MDILVLMKIISKTEEINETDLTALELAVRAREKLGGSVTVLGVHEDEDLVYLYRDAYARGADRVVVYVGKKIKNDDVFVSARVLERLIRSLGDFHLIITGERSMDTSFGVMGSILAGLLNINNVHGVYEVREFGTDRISVVSELTGLSVIEVDYPCIISVMREAAKPRIPSVKEKIAARKKQVEVHKADEVRDLDSIVEDPKITLVEVQKPVEPERRREIYTGEEGVKKVAEVIKKIMETG